MDETEKIPYASQNDSETIVSGCPKRESEDEIDKKNIINQSSKLPLRSENKL